MRLSLIGQAAVIALFFSLAVNAEAEANTFTFIKLADTNGSFKNFSSPAINNKGIVAFTANLDAGGAGVFSGNSGFLTTIADSSQFASQSVNFSSPSINDSEVVAFTVVRQTPESPTFIGLFTGNGAEPLTTIIDNNSPFSSAFASPPVINNAGSVAFVGRQSGVGNGVFIANGNPIATIADSRDSFSLFNSVSLNNSGTAAFTASLKNGSDGIFTGNSQGRSLTSVANTSQLPFRYFNGAAINDEGEVVFRAGLQDQTSERIVISSTDSVSTVAEANISGDRPFISFLSSPSINHVGMVAFEAALGGGKEGIFIGPDPVADKVIASGDSLFGSTVKTVSFFPKGLNDYGQIAFVAQLTDGTQVIVRADPNTFAQSKSRKKEHPKKQKFN